MPGASCPGPEGGALLADGDRGLVAAARGHRHEPALRDLAADVELLAARRDAGRVRHDPHLHEVDIATLRRVHLRVPDAAACAHPLCESRVDDAAVPLGVLVLDLAPDHPGDDLHILVGVGLEAALRRDDVVVAHEEQAEVGVLRVVVTAEGERMVRVEPADLRAEAVVATADVDRGDHAGHRIASPAVGHPWQLPCSRTQCHGMTLRECVLARRTDHRRHRTDFAARLAPAPGAGAGAAPRSGFAAAETLSVGSAPGATLAALLGAIH